MNKNYRIAILIILAGLILDRLTKWLVVLYIPHTSSHIIIPRLLYLTNHHNPGAAWGILQGQRVFFILITLFAVGIFIYMAKDLDFRKRKFFSIGLALLIAGALGNFIDRVLWGYVVDFIGVYIFTYRFPIFNIADSCLTIGIILFAFDLLIYKEEKSVTNDG